MRLTHVLWPQVVRPAAAAYVVAIMLTSLCTRYWHFMLAQGVLTGLSIGMAVYPALAAVPHWFLRRRAAAMGAAVAGSSLGAVAFPLALSGMLNDTNLGFGWSVRIAGFAMLPVLAFSFVALRARLPPRPARFLLPAAFRQPVYVLLVAATAVGMVAMFVPLFLIPAYAMSRGVDAALAGNLVAVLNAASVFGRVIPGVLADRFGRINMLLAAVVATGVLCFCWPQAVSTPGIAVFSVVIGFCSGAILSGASAALAACADYPRSIGTYMGMGMALSCVSALIGPPVSGKLIDTYGRYDQCAYFSGAMSFMSAILVAIAKSRTPAGFFGNA
jgi:MFS family permease